MRPRYPDWAQQAARNPPQGSRGWFWLGLAWEVRLWLSFAALLVLTAVVVTVIVLVRAL